MTKAELVQKIVERSGINKAAAQKALSAVLDGITEAAQKGETIRMIGFGTFSVSERAARTGRNPGTGEEIKIPARKVLKFKPSSTIKLEVQKEVTGKAAKKPAAKKAAESAKPAATKVAAKKAPAKKK